MAFAYSDPSAADDRGTSPYERRGKPQMTPLFLGSDPQKPSIWAKLTHPGAR